MKDNIEKSVLVGLSGGVDSAVSAALLLDAGYHVEAVTLVAFGSVDEEPIAQNIRDASSVAGQLGIKHHTLELQDAFRETVIDYFAKEYENGRTPNPCVICNRYLKFDRLIQLADKKGLAKVATGHYAGTDYSPELDRYRVFRGADTTKDQSYFLYRLTQSQLSRLVFPLARMMKADSRKKARQLGLRTAERPESQEICFIPSGDYPFFLRDYLKREFEPGPIVDNDGKLLGTHKGIIHHTVGQRQGLGIAAAHPLYVLRIDSTENKIVVGAKEELNKSEMAVQDCNYVSVANLAEPTELSVKIRYATPAQQAIIRPIGKDAIVEFTQPVSGIAPGQSAVFYDGDMLVGGGTIT